MFNNFILLLLAVISADRVQSACTEKGWFGTSCQYRCHCTDDKCHTTTGECVNGSKCVRGWFGPSCQYQDLVTEYTFIPQPAVNKLTDSDDTTCDDNAKYSITLAWNIHYRISWIRIVYTASEPLKAINLTLGNDVCDTIATSVVDNTTTDTFCYMNGIYGSLTLMLSQAVVLCSVYVNGGRNVALRQTASQSSTYAVIGINYAYAGNAVDGDRSSNFDDRSCTHTDVNLPNPTWSVTFSSVNVVDRYILYNRANFSERLRGFKLVSYSTNHLPVFNYNEEGRDLPTYTVTSEGKEIMSVTITAVRILTLCEVEIYGDRKCAPGYFGLDCDKICHCKNTSETCMSITGGCLSGCLSGYYGQGCQMECPATKWGVDCLKDCSPLCLHSKMCDRTNGSCNDGCVAGYFGSMCNLECQEGYWGESCVNTCSTHCANAKACNRRNGTCEAGCSPGYLGDTCNTECDNLTFGLNCLENCSINCGGDGKCDIVSGYCLQGCKSKYGGHVCDKLKQESGTEPPVEIIIPVVLGAIIAVSVIGVFVIFKRRKKSNDTSVETPGKLQDCKQSLESSKLEGKKINYNHNLDSISYIITMEYLSLYSKSYIRLTRKRSND
ncbi:uncharacterized protein LOC131953864 [Physella acuta]|uniref:uncharacterized protein LOC131953864 n=1 Tax=Physella acuta TaxID=109671 RepID=UPI0027DC08F0|nr:uncharacterized protein LOC131953864 [Physella acuta]